MSSELKKIRRKCIEQGKKNKSCKGCDMWTQTTCQLGIPAEWNIIQIRNWINKKGSKDVETIDNN